MVWSKKARKKYYEKHKEVVLASNKRWKDKNPEQYKTILKNYYENNKAKILAQQKAYRKNNPWYSHLVSCRFRCNNPKTDSYKYYGGRGILCLLTVKDIKFLWFRDKAYLLKQASIDRIDNDGNYILENCRFIELTKNISKAHKKPLV